MSHASDERFQELAMKLVSFECSAEEKAELRRIIDQNPARREELQKLCLSVGIARELLPLANALEATEGRMSAGEMETFKAALAQRREEQRRPVEENYGDPTVIDAEVVPEKPFNGYKLGFYVLFLLILIVGCIVLLKSCVATRPMAGNQPGPKAPNAVDSGNLPSPQPAPASPSPQPPSPVATVKEDRSSTTPAVAQPMSPPKASKLKDYRGSRWTKLADGNVKPGSVIFFRSFVGVDSSSPLIEGMIGPNTHVPNQFMLIRRQGNTWNARSYPNVDRVPKWVLPLDSTRILIVSQGMQREVSVIENGRSRDIRLPSQASIIAAHAGNGGAIFLHDYNGGVFEVSGTSVRQLPDTDPGNYVQDQGNPTGMRRGFVHAIARADSGDIMGVCYPEPPGGRPANLVRFDGSVWQNVASLGAAYPERAVHFLSGDSMVAALSREFLIVQRGEAQSLGSPAEFEADRSLVWMAVRAASTDEFVAVDLHGGVYRCDNGDVAQVVGPIPSLRGVGSVGFRSVMIAPDGVIYGIHAKDQWSQSILYQLVPK